MDRAYLALVQKRLKLYEAALLDRASAEAEGIPNAHATEVAERKASLERALMVWRRSLGLTL